MAVSICSDQARVVNLVEMAMLICYRHELHSTRNTYCHEMLVDVVVRKNLLAIEKSAAIDAKKVLIVLFMLAEAYFVNTGSVADIASELRMLFDRIVCFNFQLGRKSLAANSANPIPVSTFGMSVDGTLRFAPVTARAVENHRCKRATGRTASCDHWKAVVKSQLRPENIAW